MDILLWLLPAAVVTVVAMLWVGWLGRARREPDEDAALRRLGKALDRPARGGYAVPERPVHRSNGVAVRGRPRPGAGEGARGASEHGDRQAG